MALPLPSHHGKLQNVPYLVQNQNQYTEIDQEITGKEFAFPKPKIQFCSDETQVGQLPSQISEVAEVTNFIVAGSTKI